MTYARKPHLNTMKIAVPVAAGAFAVAVSTFAVLFATGGEPTILGLAAISAVATGLIGIGIDPRLATNIKVDGRIAFGALLLGGGLLASEPVIVAAIFPYSYGFGYMVATVLGSVSCLYGSSNAIAIDRIRPRREMLEEIIQR